MFEIAELGQKLSKEEYRALVPHLRMELLRLQTQLKKAPFPVLLVFGGFDGAGRSETVQTLHEWLDPRFLETHAFDTGPSSDEEAERPTYWRFWKALPPRGRIGMFLGSWYTAPMLSRLQGELNDAELEATLQRINTFEGELAADGALILKFWFHLSREGQKKRLKKLSQDPTTRWRVQPVDREAVRHYDEIRQVAEHTLRLTSTGIAPWIIVDGSNRRHREVFVGQRLAQILGVRLDSHEEPSPNGRLSSTPQQPALPYVSILSRLDLAQEVDRATYEKELEQLQNELWMLTRKAARRGLSTVLLFEGWDAAGKGGVVRRVVGGLDPRDVTLVPIAAPTDEERAHHYLWRFWRHLPRAGRVTIFDRSWYGRVLVERVEGYARFEEWLRAYKEINDFEQQLVDHGIVLLKFWLHIDRDTQLERFQEREKTPYKNFKIGPDDWRNREKWDDYERAVNDMIERCSTEFAPWTLVEAKDKYFARLKVLRTICGQLRQWL